MYSVYIFGIMFKHLHFTLLGKPIHLCGYLISRLLKAQCKKMQKSRALANAYSNHHNKEKEGFL